MPVEMPAGPPGLPHDRQARCGDLRARALARTPSATPPAGAAVRRAGTGWSWCCWCCHARPCRLRRVGRGIAAKVRASPLLDVPGTRRHQAQTRRPAQGLLPEPGWLHRPGLRQLGFACESRGFGPKDACLAQRPWLPPWHPRKPSRWLWLHPHGRAWARLQAPLGSPGQVSSHVVGGSACRRRPPGPPTPPGAASRVLGQRPPGAAGDGPAVVGRPRSTRGRGITVGIPIAFPVRDSHSSSLPHSALTCKTDATVRPAAALQPPYSRRGSVRQILLPPAVALLVVFGSLFEVGVDGRGRPEPQASQPHSAQVHSCARSPPWQYTVSRRPASLRNPMRRPTV